MTKAEAWKQAWKCDNCFAIAWGGPVHGEGMPCPQKVKIDEAYIEMLDAQRMSYLRSGASMSDMAAFIAKMTGADDDV